MRNAFFAGGRCWFDSVVQWFLSQLSHQIKRTADCEKARLMIAVTLTGGTRRMLALLAHSALR